MKRWLLTGLIFCAGLTIGGIGGWQVGRAQGGSPSEEARGLATGQRPPRIEAVDFSGTRHTLEQYEGQVLVLHFWASWCPFCRSQIPDLTTLAQEWSDRDVAVLTIGVDDDLEPLRQFMEQEGLPYPVIPDTGSPSLSERYVISSIPVTYILGRDGRIISRFVGRADLLPAVESALDGSTASTI